MKIILATDLPIWIRPLARALDEAGAECVVATAAAEVPVEGIIVNRISALLADREPEKASEWGAALARWQDDGRKIINGLLCYRLGQSKLELARHLEKHGFKTPKTRLAIPGRRAMPELAVLLKPPAGGFGKGIVALEAGQAAAKDLFDAEAGWTEQERLTPADGMVHRIEFLGGRILYEARSPHCPDDFNYCLAKAGDEVTLLMPGQLPGHVRKTACSLAESAELLLGAIEYFVDYHGEPVFFDLNPVSSLHPRSADCLGLDPWEMVAGYLIEESSESP